MKFNINTYNCSYVYRQLPSICFIIISIWKFPFCVPRWSNFFFFNFEEKNKWLVTFQIDKEMYINKNIESNQFFFTLDEVISKGKKCDIVMQFVWFSCNFLDATVNEPFQSCCHDEVIRTLDLYIDQYGQCRKYHFIFD